MSVCPCCSQTLLRHIRHGNIYWFCSSCWQEMPNSDSIVASAHRGQALERLLNTKQLGMAQPKELLNAI